MRTLSILQPYAWLIVRPDIIGEEARVQAYREGTIKDIENRSWPTRYRGPILVHAGRRYPKRDYEDDREYFYESSNIILPAYDDIPRGGIVGRVDIVDCAHTHASQWKMDGTWGFVLANAQPLPFFPVRGQLGFFNVVIPGEQRG